VKEALHPHVRCYSQIRETDRTERGKSNSQSRTASLCGMVSKEKDEKGEGKEQLDWEKDRETRAPGPVKRQGRKGAQQPGGYDKTLKHIGELVEYLAKLGGGKTSENGVKKTGKIKSRVRETYSKTEK